MGDAFKSIHPFQSTFSAALTGTGTDSSHGISYEQQEESRRSRRLWDTLDGSLILCSFMAVRIEWELSASELVQAFNHPLLGLVALIGCILVRLAFLGKVSTRGSAMVDPSRMGWPSCARPNASLLSPCLHLDSPPFLLRQSLWNRTSGAR